MQYNAGNQLQERQSTATRRKHRLQQIAQAPPSTLFAIANPNHIPQLDSVIIRDLTYQVGSGSKRKTILNRINLTVPEGSIYGLLGPSGCGKTTMLRCMVGRIQPKSGSVMVFGLRPGKGRGEVPGRDVGYMPQEISIYEDFTIEETLSYFGKINRMPTSHVRKRIEFLLRFLDLPSKKRAVANLSGGQKRRVSLAAALVHSPPLLILDEPTVGVDPLLRQSIWQHLVAMTKTERISVIITTHYIEEARLANVVGLMRNGRILAEDSPDELMHTNRLDNLEAVFLKLCVTDSSRLAARLAVEGGSGGLEEVVSAPKRTREDSRESSQLTEAVGLSSAGDTRRFQRGHSDENERRRGSRKRRTTTRVIINNGQPSSASSTMSHDERLTFGASQQQAPATSASSNGKKLDNSTSVTTVKIHTGLNRIEHDSSRGAFVNEAVEVFSSEEENDSDILRDDCLMGTKNRRYDYEDEDEQHHLERQPVEHLLSGRDAIASASLSSYDNSLENYLDLQSMHWDARRANVSNLLRLNNGRHLNKGPYLGLDGRTSNKSNAMVASMSRLSAGGDSNFFQWWKTLMAVTWKNYVRLRRNPPVLVFQFLLPAIQVILFCLCIGGEPFDVPVAIVNEEIVPKSSIQFLNGLNKKIIRQIKYDNLTSALDAVKRGKVWGAVHIPDKYSENLQSRLIMGEEVTNETISNGTIRVYPDLTNLHLAMTLETTFRETFINFARNSLEELGYERSLADLPIQVARPIHGTMKKESYLEFMAPGVVISISYVMATGLTALAFILERRDGLLERSLISGVQTSQILLAHAINQVFVMVIQIILVLGCTFFIFEIPSRGPFIWVILLILLQGCTGMGFGLLVSAICAEENTAVMMVVGTFYTNLILSGIIWPIEAMPQWLRPLSYAQPQTLPTNSLRHILSRGWTITEPGVLLGFAVTIGWLVVFLIAAGVIFKYSR